MHKSINVKKVLGRNQAELSCKAAGQPYRQLLNTKGEVQNQLPSMMFSALG